MNQQTEITNDFEQTIQRYYNQLNEEIQQYKQNPESISKWQLMKKISILPKEDRNKYYEEAMGPTHHSQAMKKRRIAQQMKKQFPSEMMKYSKQIKVLKKDTFEKVVENIATLQCEVRTFISTIREVNKPETMTSYSHFDYGSFNSFNDSRIDFESDEMFKDDISEKDFIENDDKDGSTESANDNENNGSTESVHDE